MSGESFEAAGTDQPGNPPVGKVRRRWARDRDGIVVQRQAGPVAFRQPGVVTQSPDKLLYSRLNNESKG